MLETWANVLRVPAEPMASAAALQLKSPKWAHDLAARRGMLEVLNAETLRTHEHPLLSADHMVTFAEGSRAAAAQ